MNISGREYGRWTVGEAALSRGKHPYWNCTCACGGLREVNQSSLVSGLSKSCGCLSKEVTAVTGKANKTHGLSNSPTYNVWNSMLQRCHNPQDPGYLRYGGRGIFVCASWSNFEGFLRDMGEQPSGLSLDRVDNSQGYSRANCRWATNKQQSRNIRTNRIITYRGEHKTLVQWCEDLGLNYFAVHSRLDKYNWTVARAFSTPTRSSYRSLT